MNGRPRVVITGLGVFTSLASNVSDFWEALLAGKSGIGPITRFDASALPTRIAGEVKGFDPEAYLPRKEARRMARCSQLAVGAAQDALKDAGLTIPVAEGERTGTAVGVGMGRRSAPC